VVLEVVLGRAEVQNILAAGGKGPVIAGCRRESREGLGWISGMVGSWRGITWRKLIPGRRALSPGVLALVLALIFGPI